MYQLVPISADTLPACFSNTYLLLCIPVALVVLVSYAWTFTQMCYNAAKKLHLSLKVRQSNIADCVAVDLRRQATLCKEKDLWKKIYHKELTA